MKTMESLEDFYKRKFDFILDNLKKEFGQFSIFNLKPNAGENGKVLRLRDIVQKTVKVNH